MRERRAKAERVMRERLMRNRLQAQSQGHHPSLLPLDPRRVPPPPPPPPRPTTPTPPPRPPTPLTDQEIAHLEKLKTRATGFDRGLELEKICGATDTGGE